MRRESLFLDTAFVVALINPRDQYHTVAQRLLPKIEKARQIWTTRFVLTEIGNGLSAEIYRQQASGFMNQIFASKNLYKIADQDDAIFMRGFVTFQNRPDKSWGLVDCISFAVMEEKNIKVALTTDQHFVQAGFRALMLESDL
jgi:uncharacterized protein